MKRSQYYYKGLLLVLNLDGSWISFYLSLEIAMLNGTTCLNLDYCVGNGVITCTGLEVIILELISERNVKIVMYEINQGKTCR